MLAIRLQRRGRKGLAQYRIIVQESRLSPKSEKVVAYLGAYNPHNQETTLDKKEAEKFLKNGAQPSQRVARILKDNKVKLPDWVEIDTSKSGDIKNPEKLRKNQPKEEAEEAPEEDSKEESKESEEKADNKDDSAEEKKSDKEEKESKDDTSDSSSDSEEKTK